MGKRNATKSGSPTKSSVALLSLIAQFLCSVSLFCTFYCCHLLLLRNKSSNRSRFSFTIVCLQENIQRGRAWESFRSLVFIPLPLLLLLRLLLLRVVSFEINFVASESGEQQKHMHHHYTQNANEILCRLHCAALLHRTCSESHLHFAEGKPKKKKTKKH